MWHETRPSEEARIQRKKVWFRDRPAFHDGLFVEKRRVANLEISVRSSIRESLGASQRKEKILRWKPKHWISPMQRIKQLPKNHGQSRPCARSVDYSNEIIKFTRN